MAKLRVGIIGLGKRWRRYRPALRALRDHFAIQAIYDAVHQAALHVAQRLGCAATSGVIELLERKDIDAILLLDAAWQGLWPLEAACRFGKTVFCAVPLEAEAAHAETVCRKVRGAQLPVMMALPLRLAPATLRLQELLRNHLGKPRLLLAHQAGTKPGRIRASLLDCCLSIFDAAPQRVQVLSEYASPLAEVHVDFGEKRTARLCRWSGPFARRELQLHVVAERGTAFIGFPSRVCWNDADGRHIHIAAKPRPSAELLLESFYQATTAGQPIQPDWEDAYRAFQWLHPAHDAS